MKRLPFLLILLTLSVQITISQNKSIDFATQTNATSSNKKPKVALVLSGGGAKGLAHIPTLQVLDSLGIVPDLIVGTSMGSIVGGLYAMGYSGDSIANIAKRAQWGDLMGGGISLRDVSTEEKSEFGHYFIELDWVNGNLNIGNFLLNDQNLREFIALYTYPIYNLNNFDDLAIPFRAVATDIVKGEEVILDKGSLSLAMRASMSIPGVFQAVPYEETLLVDGGLMNNFPVDVAKAMGADFIIGSDVGSGLMDKQKLDYLPSLLFQTSMINSNLKRPHNRDLCDILIDHSSSMTYSTGDFKKANDIYSIGRIAVDQKIEALISFSKVLQKYQQRSVALPQVEDKFFLNKFVIEGISEHNLALVRARASIQPNTSYSLQDIIESVNRAMGTAMFKQIVFRAEMVDNETVLHLNAVERSPHQVKASLHYDGNHGIGLIANYTGRNILGNASRTLVTADVAEQPKLQLQYQNNFGTDRDWWWRIELYGQLEKQKVYIGGEYVENTKNRYHAFDNQINRNLSSLRSYVGLGIKYHNTYIKPTINPLVNENIFKFKKYTNYDIEMYAHYNYNSMDKKFFSTRGALLKVFLGRLLRNNINMEFSEVSLPHYDGPSNGFTRLGIDYENRFLITEKTAMIIGVSSHFIFEDSQKNDAVPFSDLGLNSKYTLGGNINTPRSDYFIFPGLKEGEVRVNQFAKINLAIQYQPLNNIYITPHINVATVGFKNFTDYIENAFIPKGKWSDATASSFLFSAGTTFSYNSFLGPINFDASYVNDINKIRIFMGIGFHLDRSN